MQPHIRGLLIIAAPLGAPVSSVLRSKGALLLALALPAVGAVEFALQLFFEPRAPAADEYGALLPAIEALHHEGDLVVVKSALGRATRTAGARGSVLPVERRRAGR